jgi:hypothetical protein
MQKENDFLEALGLTYKEFEFNNYKGVIFYNESFIGYLTKDSKVEIEKALIYKTIEINRITEDFIEGNITNLNEEKIYYSFDTNNKVYLIKNQNSHATFLDGTLIRNNSKEFISELLIEFPILLNNINKIERKK